MTTQQLEILQHALGLDQYGQGPQQRNHYVGAEPVCEELVRMGLMTKHKRSFVPDPIYLVTTEGKKVVREHSPKPPTLTRSQRRYREWLRCASDHCTFGEYLKRK